MSKKTRPLLLVISILLALLPLVAFPTLAKPISNPHYPFSLYELSTSYLRSPTTTIPVTTLSDELNADGDCSLREAIQAANTDSPIDACLAGVGADTITLSAGTYTLTLTGANENANQTGDLDIISNLIINGSGVSNTIIYANGTFLNDRAFDIQAPVTASFNNLTIQGGQPIGAGFPSGCGAAISIPFAGSTVTINESRLTDNVSSSSGGAICNWGIFIVNNSTLDNNHVVDFAGNGGAIWSDTGATATINNSTLAYNSAPVAGVGGGALFVDGVLNLNNSTLSSNSTTGNGGAIWSASAVAIHNSTFYNNAAGAGQALYQNVGTATIQNTLITAHVGSACVNFSGTSLNNLVDDATCGIAANPVTNFDTTLMDNGGPTHTHALFAGSNGIDTGTANCPDHTGTPLATDQRGVTRPQGIICDMGAYEKAPANLLPLANNDIFTTTQDTPLNVSAPGVLINDTDPELDQLAAFLTTAPATGTLSWNGNGSFDYTPPGGYTGVITFSYAASDNQGIAVQFDGVDSYIDLGDSYESFGDISVEAWVYRDFATGAFEEIFSKDVVNSFSIDNLGQFHFNLGDGAVWGAGVSSVAPVPLNQWVHLAATWDSTTGETKLYINGLLDNSATNSLIVGNNGFARGIGQKPAFDSSTFPGAIDEVRVWNIVRTGAEIKTGMWDQLIGSETGLIGYYKLNDGAGLLATDSVGNVDGTLTDFTPGMEWVNSAHPFSNIATVTITILPTGAGPDLTIPTLLASPNDVCQGQFFALVFAIANQGSLDAGAHQVFVYNDPELNGFTNQTFTATIPGVLAGQTRYFSLSANSFITGTRYIKALADGMDVISETTELNNSNVIPVTIQPDPPPDGSLLINGGATSASLPDLTLTLSATDTGNCATSPVEMRFVYEGLTTPWEPYTTTKNIVVSGIGEVRVAVQFRDEHNNVSGWIDATILVGNYWKIYLPVIQTSPTGE